MSAGAVWGVHGAKMAAERQDALREFVAVTGAEEDRARFFLESAGWDLQVAPRGGPFRAGWEMRCRLRDPSAAEAHSHPCGAGPWPRPHGLWGRLPRVAGLAWKLMDAGEPRPALQDIGFPAGSQC